MSRVIKGTVNSGKTYSGNTYSGTVVSGTTTSGVKESSLVKPSTLVQESTLVQPSTLTSESTLVRPSTLTSESTLIGPSTLISDSPSVTSGQSSFTKSPSSFVSGDSSFTGSSSLPTTKLEKALGETGGAEKAGLLDLNGNGTIADDLALGGALALALLGGRKIYKNHKKKKAKIEAEREKAEQAGDQSEDFAETKKGGIGGKVSALAGAALVGGATTKGISSQVAKDNQAWRNTILDSSLRRSKAGRELIGNGDGRAPLDWFNEKQIAYNKANAVVDDLVQLGKNQGTFMSDQYFNNADRIVDQAFQFNPSNPGAQAAEEMIYNLKDSDLEEFTKISQRNPLDLNNNGSIADEGALIGLALLGGAALGKGAHSLYKKHKAKKAGDQSESKTKKSSNYTPVGVGLTTAATAIQSTPIINRALKNQELKVHQKDLSKTYNELFRRKDVAELFVKDGQVTELGQKYPTEMLAAQSNLKNSELAADTIKGRMAQVEDRGIFDLNGNGTDLDEFAMIGALGVGSALATKGIQHLWKKHKNKKAEEKEDK